MRDWKEEFQPPRTCLPWLRDWTEWTPPSTCFEPTTLMIASLAATAGSTALGAAGQAKQYSATSNEAEYRAQVAANNRTIAEQNARYAAQAGRTNAQAQDFQTAAQLGQARAAYGASGVDVGTGSPSDVQRSIGQLGRLKSLEEIQQAALASYGYEQKASDFGAEAGLEKYKASSARAAAPLAIGGTILGGAGSLAGKWAMFKNPYGGYGATGAGAGYGPWTSD
jgi:hypothetical protein